MRYPDDFAVARREERAMEDETSIETCITVAEDEARVEDFEAARLRAELATLRRTAAAWDRLRLVLRQYALWPDDGGAPGEGGGAR